MSDRANPGDFEDELRSLKQNYNQQKQSGSDQENSDVDLVDSGDEVEVDEDEEYNDPPSRGGSTSKRRLQRDYSDEDDQYDENENDDDEEDYDHSRNTSRKGVIKKKKRRTGGNMFLDVEAAVDSEDEDEDEGADLEGDFIADDEAELAQATRDVLRNERRFIPPPQEEDAEEIAARLKDRYTNYSTRRAPVAMEQLPKQFIIPSVQDPHLYVARCLIGKERDVVFQIMRRYFEKAETDNPLRILSAYCRDGLRGYVYIEAIAQSDAQLALERVAGLTSQKVTLIPIGQMVDVVRVKKKENPVQPGAWVRVKRGKYAGDLAQVLAIIDSTDSAELKLVPRIDYEEQYTQDGKKIKSYTSNGQPARAAQKLFDPREVEGIDMNKPVIPRGSDVFHWSGDVYNKGYLEKEFKLISLQTTDVSPTLEEITLFSAGDSAALIEAASAAAAINHSQHADDDKVSEVAIGDNVEVVEGDLVGISGTVISIENDGIIRVKLNSNEVNRSGYRRTSQAIMSFRQRQLRKFFRAGDHVKVLRGKNSGVTGSVVAVDTLIVTLISDLSLNEVRVFAKDLTQSKEVASVVATNKFDKNDLISLDGGRTVAIVLASEKGLYKVLDQNNEVLTVKNYEATAPFTKSNFSSAIDSNGQEIKKNDLVVETVGLRRSGTIVQLNRFVAFVRSENIIDNGGIFATRVRSLASSTLQQDKLNPFSNSKFQIPNQRRQPRARPPPTFRGRDPIIGQIVLITRGSFKGYMGVVKETAASMARVELHTSARIVNVERDKLDVKLKDGRTVPSATFGNPGGNRGSDSRSNSRMGTPRSGMNSSFPPGTPNSAASFGGNSWQDSARSGMPSASPAWNVNASSASGGDPWGSSEPASGGWGSGETTGASQAGLPETPAVSWGSSDNKVDSTGGTDGWASFGGSEAQDSNSSFGTSGFGDSGGMSNSWDVPQTPGVPTPAPSGNSFADSANTQEKNAGDSWGSSSFGTPGSSWNTGADESADSSWNSGANDSAGSTWNSGSAENSSTSWNSGGNGNVGSVHSTGNNFNSNSGYQRGGRGGGRGRGNYSSHDNSGYNRNNHDSGYRGNNRGNRGNNNQDFSRNNYRGNNNSAYSRGGRSFDSPRPNFDNPRPSWRNNANDNSRTPRNDNSNDSGNFPSASWGNNAADDAGPAWGNAAGDDSGPSWDSSAGASATAVPDMPNNIDPNSSWNSSANDNPGSSWNNESSQDTGASSGNNNNNDRTASWDAPRGNAGNSNDNSTSGWGNTESGGSSWN